MEAIELGAEERRVLLCIHAYAYQEGLPPTIREIQKRCGMSSPSVVQNYVDALQRKGCIRRRRGRLRTITLTANGHRRAGGQGAGRGPQRAAADRGGFSKPARWGL